MSEPRCKCCGLKLRIKSDVITCDRCGQVDGNPYNIVQKVGSRHLCDECMYELGRCVICHKKIADEDAKLFNEALICSKCYKPNSSLTE